MCGSRAYDPLHARTRRPWTSGRAATAWPRRTLAFLLFGPPILIAGVVPAVLSRWHVGDAFFGWHPWRWIGLICIVAGALVVSESAARFARAGRGTPAPWSPPRQFVAGGLYRFVRNPMYLGVLALIAGQALLFGSVAVLVWAGLNAVHFHLFVVLYEERTLRRRFGAAYDAYRREVPRWLPRLRPWSPPRSQS